ncbi:unnamed protein product [Arabidopsis thaliana]|uniref:Uncharacterized protein n=2 Tax=Arabidopsis thaliana TaxID=3702 RepID=A0A654FKR3_ARATH|nr:uncharacterized protein AT4G00925 [Arabidopsis thaliana]ANM67846.1 hypothetical protein AT4G00925 [Arabidopsis thaliana]CAA0392897.1 unnamed protein product [Arabidopsis thaliana]VYS61437.1 unnamed protein product [Arabidopsis thaliana]|eukprot:NP_001329647.1 hypothetical protein AT4G00925 [Arabidopsis thaliana]
MVPKFVRKWRSEEDSDGNLQAKRIMHRNKSLVPYIVKRIKY